MDVLFGPGSGPCPVDWLWVELPIAKPARSGYIQGMENTTENLIKADPRWNASGVGACNLLGELLAEHLHSDECATIGLRQNYLLNAADWRPSDALRQAAAEHLRGNVYRGYNA